MATRHWVGVAILLIMAVVVKAQWLFYKIVVLAAAGLAGLFLIHLVATDYRKIQMNRPKAFGLFKRSIETTTEILNKADMESKFSEAQRQLEGLQRANVVENNDFSLLGAAVRLDPQGCARRYVCAVAAKPKESLTGLEYAMLQLIERAPQDADAFREAAQLGRRAGDGRICRKRYPGCTFTVTEMLRLVQPVY